MKTKTRGGIVTKNLSGWMQDYTWSTSIQDWVPYGSKVPYVNPIHNGKLETITYDDSVRKGTIKRTRKCLHTVEEHEDHQESHQYYVLANGSRKRQYVSGGSYSPGSLTIPNLASVHSEALTFFKSGCVEKYFDLAVDLFEWKQVATLLPSLSSTIKSLGKNYLKFKNLDFKKDSKRALKDLSDLHLSYSFGIKPLVSDIMDFIEAVKALEEKVAWLRKNQGKPVKVSFKKDLSKSTRPSTTVTQDSVTKVQDTVIDWRCYYHAYALVVYNVEGLSDLELKLRVLTRNFGLDQPASMIWERIPFSFVLDWIVKIGDLIENLSPSITLPYTFLDIGWTIKIREARCKDVFFNYPYKGDNYHHYGTLRRSLFYREPGLPTSFSLATGDPGANQLALAISLAIQRWK